MLTQVLAKFREEFHNSLAKSAPLDLAQTAIFLKGLHPLEAVALSSETIPGLERLSLDSFLKTLLQPLDHLKEN